MKTLRFKSPAKLNLYLRILNKRPDGYHDIVTLFERIDLFDDIILRLRPSGIKILCSNPRVPKGSKNLAYKAAKALSSHTEVKKGVEIEIIKRIPIGAGLGGGSSNAAVVLGGLNRLWGLKLGKKSLMKIGKKLGADVNFFLLGARFATAVGIGDKLKPLDIKRRLWHVLVAPKKSLSTKEIYASRDALNAAKSSHKIILTAAMADVKILHHSIQKNDLILLGKSLHNDLELAARARYNIILIIKEMLKSCGSKGILMSGSGPAVFGIVPSGREAMRIRQELLGLRKGWQIIAAKTW